MNTSEENVSASEDICNGSSSQYESSVVETEDEEQPSTSKNFVRDTTLLSKVKIVSMRTQSDMIKQVAGTAKLPVKGL